MNYSGVSTLLTAYNIRAIVIGDEIVSAMERTASQGDFRANLSKGGYGRSINLSEAETAMCIKAAKAVGLEFAGVDLIREKMGQTYVTEVNGNPGTGIIDITKKNHFENLIKFIEIKTKKTKSIPSSNENDEELDRENAEEASIKSYRELLFKQEKGNLDYNESVRLTFLRNKVGNRIRI